MSSLGFLIASALGQLGLRLSNKYSSPIISQPLIVPTDAVFLFRWNQSESVIFGDKHRPISLFCTAHHSNLMLHYVGVKGERGGLQNWGKGTCNDNEWRNAAWTLYSIGLSQTLCRSDIKIQKMHLITRNLNNSFNYARPICNVSFNQTVTALFTRCYQTVTTLFTRC